MTAQPAAASERFREASTLLRTRAQAAQRGPWKLMNDSAWTKCPLVCETSGHTSYGGPVDDQPAHFVVAQCISGLYGDADAAYIATVHPLIGLAVAELLDQAADFTEDRPHGYEGVSVGITHLADTILAEVS